MRVKKKFLLFDIDGTLVHAGGAGRRALNAALGEVGVDERLVRNVSFAGRTDREIILSALRAAGLGGGGLPGRLDRVLTAYSAHLAAHLEAAPARAYPLARELLQACRLRPDLELALLTGNAPEGARLKLESAGLGGYFSWGVFGDFSEVRVDLAREALRRIGPDDGRVARRDVFVIGDTAADVACGRAIGAFTVAVVSDFEPREALLTSSPDLLIEGFAPLFSLWDLPAPA